MLSDNPARAQWAVELEAIAAETGLDAVLIMESREQTMRVVAASEQPIYRPGDEGSKSVQSGCHELYCERVVNTGRGLYVPDASQDPDWSENEDLVCFGLRAYLGIPLRRGNEVVGTLCALNGEPFGQDVLTGKLLVLGQRVEAALNADD